MESFFIDLPIASIFRSKYGTYSEYHTSLDDFKIVTLKGLIGGLKVAQKSIEILLENIYPKTKFLCEPKMSKRKLYSDFSIKKTNKKFNLTKSIMDFLQYSDGTNSLKKISNLINLNLTQTKKIFKILKDNKLISF